MLLGILVGLGLFSLCLYSSYQQKDHLTEKRTYIFEKDNGQKYNPFNSIDEGASDDGWTYTEDYFK